MIYVEEQVADHRRTREILRRFPDAEVVSCRRYGEVFRRGGHGFRLTKRRPALVLAAKRTPRLASAPTGYALGRRRSRLLSAVLNCIYDCRYCYLQGRFGTAHYVVFVNFEDFERDIDEALAAAGGERVDFYSGYHSDSLALEPVTRFAEHFLPFFAARPRGWLELRTKSSQVRPLLDAEPAANVVPAFSFTPQRVAGELERLTPPVEVRLSAMERLQERGWRLGLRFDPLIRHPGWAAGYRRLFADVFARLRPEAVHSATLGPFRLSRSGFTALAAMHPDEPLFAEPLADHGPEVGYPDEIEAELRDFCTAELGNYLPAEILYPNARAV